MENLVDPLVVYAFFLGYFFNLLGEGIWRLIGYIRDKKNKESE